jgi:hypothetical protein
VQSDYEAAVPSHLHDPFRYQPLPPSEHQFRLVDGVFRIYEDETSDQDVFPVPGTDKEFFTDLLHLCKVGASGPIKTYCHHRLVLLEQKFNLHVMLNADKEYLAQKVAPHRDFYNVRKVPPPISSASQTPDVRLQQIGSLCLLLCSTLLFHAIQEQHMLPASFLTFLVFAQLRRYQCA